MTAQQQIIDGFLTQCRTILKPAYQTNLGSYTRYALNVDAQYKAPLLNVVDEPEETVFSNENLRLKHGLKVRIEAVFPSTEQNALAESCNAKADILEAIRAMPKPQDCVILPERSVKTIQGEGQLIIFVAVIFSVTYKTDVFQC